MQEDAKYFSDPGKEAVLIITGLIRDDNWKELSLYYDLDGSGIRRERLESGEFFIRTRRPEVAHPAEFWRHKHPFSPEFQYDFHSETDGIATVNLSITIDQGGGMVQRGMSSFRMKRSEKGYQILPDMGQRSVPEAPATTEDNSPGPL